MNQQSTLVGLFKEVYGSNIIEAWSFMAKLAKRVNFVAAEQQPGGNYNQPVDVQFEHGISSAAAGTTPGAASSPLFFSPTAGQMQNAQITGAQLVGRSQVSYEAIARSANSKGAFKQATQHVVRRLSQAVIKRLEIQLLHGQAQCGIVASAAAETGGAGAYFTVVTLTDAEWSTGLWAGMVGAYIDVFQSGGAARVGNNINTGATSGNTGWCRVSAVDTAAKTVTLNYGTTMTVTANDVLMFANGGNGSGASTTLAQTRANEMAGLDFITALNASSGTFQNIATGTYDLWRANQYSSSTGVLSFPKLLEAAGLAASYGLVDDLVAVISPRAFEVLNSDIAALRQYDASYTPARGENGVSKLLFNGQTGAIEVMPHAFQKDGLAHLFCPNEALRVGASDVGFITRQGSEDRLILESSTAAASEMRAYSNQALFISQPRHTVRMAGLTY